MAHRLVSPIFVVAAPRSGEEALFDALAQASGIWHSPLDRPPFLDSLPALDPAQRGYDSHRLSAADAEGVSDEVAERLAVGLLDREGRELDRAAPDVRALASGARLALRIPFLDAAFPDARFVCVFRDPAQATSEMLEAWRSERFVSCPDLPGWDGPPWSLPLIPGWRELRGLPVEQIVVEQWRTISELMLDDLSQLGPERWAVADHARLLEDPRHELRRLCAFLDLAYDQALLSPLEAAARRDAGQTASPTPQLGSALPSAAAVAARGRELLAAPPPPPPSTTAPTQTPETTSPFRSVSTGSFAQLLRRLGSSLLISTYQTGKLICARDQNRLLNTHFREFEKPMGLAVADGRFALATRTEIWDFRNMPDVAPKLEPPGTHDACFLPRNRHTTGDILAHELAFADGELWVVATAFSCLARLDSDHSFIPEWTPPFISGLAPGDRCHLNGVAVVDDKVRYVTALGQTDEPAGWRASKATGGCIIDVPSSEIVCAGLSMPHSPRWHDGRLWVLESGRGALGTVDLDHGATEPVIELPGFTRGLAFAGDLAFVGLSQIRESSTFGDLPLTERLQERICGVWVVNTKRGEVVAFLRFEDLVQEIFDVALLPGVRFPEIAEPGSTAVSTSFVLP